AETGVRKAVKRDRKRRTMAMPMTKVTVGKSGYGAAHAAYITRLSALDPNHKESRDPNEEPERDRSVLVQDDKSGPEPSVSETLNENLNARALDDERSMAGGQVRDADPIWTWNAPGFLTGERQGPGSERAEPAQSVADKRPTEDEERTK